MDNKLTPYKSFNNIDRQKYNYNDYADARSEDLEKFKNFALSTMNYIRKNGLAFEYDNDNKRSYLIETGDARYSGTMIGAPIHPKGSNDEINPVVIINTVNDGFHFMGRENGKNYDMGKVDVPCIIGDGYHAHGIYIPINKNIIDSLLMISDDIDKAEEKKKNTSDDDYDDYINE